MVRNYMRVARVIGLIAAGVVLTACLLVLLGAHFYKIPVVSSIGSMVLSVFGPWLVVIPLGAGVFAAWVWRGSNARSALVLLVAAAVAAIWGAAAVARMVLEARHHGVSIDLARALAVRILPGWNSDADLVYGAWRDEPLHVIVYKPAETAPRRLAPVLVYIHGGGFTIGDRFESGTNLRWFADHGWLVLSIDYTLSSADRHLWDTSTSQVGCAMAWTAANAARLGGDSARLSLVGSSAGGNLAINAGYLANAGRLESSCGGSVPRVAAVIALYPPVDLAAAWENPVPGMSQVTHRFNTNYLGGSPEQFPDRYLFVASATHINAGAPPTLVIFGENDHLVPPAATDRFAERAQRSGIKIEAVRFPYGDHAFNLNQYGIGNQFFLSMTQQFLKANY
jgi:acetyl esterase/lipase